ncbi:MAG: LacI family DNA-binding transcriptional regulator [Pseudorhodobacter sp.]
MKPKLADIARNLQVSTATVSLALSGKGRVSPAMIERIKQEAAKLGYRPDQNGKALRTGRTNLIGLVLPDVSNVLFPRMARAIATAAEERGYGVLIADSRDSAEMQDEALRRLVDLGADALVVIPRKGTEIGTQPIPVAVIDAPGAPQNMISADHAGGGALLTEHLQEAGHRNILCVGETRSSLVQRTRIAGMLSAAGAGSTISQDWLEDDPDIPAAIRSGVTAIACTSDTIALRLLTELGQAGMMVPQDVSLTGFDNLDLGLMVRPQLTTVGTSETELGNRAIDRLIQLINDGDGRWGDVVPMHLISRETVSTASNRENGDESD